MIKAIGIGAKSAKSKLEIYSFERRDPLENDVVIDIKYCGICHSDIHQVRNEWGASKYPMVPGHEISGIVKSVGAKVTKYKAGDRVGVGCFVDSCRSCSSCKESLENYCLTGSIKTYNSIEKDGVSTTKGGYSNVIVVDENYVLQIPDSIPLDKAAPLLCAGITLYSPLMHWKVGSGKRVGIIGMGGLGHMGVKIGVALGAEISVLSHSDKKREDSISMGAENFINSTNEENFKKYSKYFDLIINTVAADIDVSKYLELLKLDGSMVSLGIPDKPININVSSLILMRRNYSGSLIGGIKETQEMLNFCAENKILPEIELITPDYINDAYERVLKSDVKYRFVIDMKFN